MDKCTENPVGLIVHVHVSRSGQKGVRQDNYTSRHINSAVVHLV